MAKYIDADLLRKEIDHRIDILADVSIKCAKNDDMEMHNYYHGKAISLEELLHFIDSLRQEEPAPSCRTCGFYENNCPYIRGKLIPYPSRVCNDYTYSVIKAQQEEKK